MAQFFDNKHMYEAVVTPVDSPGLRDFSVNLNGRHYSGLCYKPIKVPGWAINTLMDAAIKRKDTEVTEDGFLRTNKDVYREPRWAVQPLRDMTTGATVGEMTPTSRFVDIKADRMAQLEGMGVIALRKEAQSKGFKGFDRMDKKTLLTLLRYTGEDEAQ